MPFLESAPGTAASINTFINVLRTFESGFPASERTNLPHMITILRDIYYGLDSWDDILITSAGGKNKRHFKTQELNTTKTDLYDPDPSIWVQKKRYEVRDVDTTLLWHPVSGGTCTCGLSKIYHLQEINAGGYYLDIGHVFAGLDALFHPNKVWTLPSQLVVVTVDSNADAVTWLGDLASVLGEWHFASNEVNTSRPGTPPRILTISQMQAILTELAPARDMLGNVDAYVLYDKLFYPATVSSPPGAPPCVSDLLEEYYLQPNTYINKRFTTFTGHIGLTWDPATSTFKNLSTWLKKNNTELANCTSMYYGANTDGTTYGAVARRARAVILSHDETNPETLNKVMVKELTGLVAKE